MIREDLLNWYGSNKRDLPWRKTTNPYLIWLSEIILQQTRVEQGMPYYYRFIEEFPTVKDLAQAQEKDVLRLWQGLGYYSRARNIHFTAKYICETLNGVFPTTYDGLLKLKGIGPYTAAAIASIAYNEPKAVVDGNVYRVLARLTNNNTPINETKGIKHFQTLANELIDSKVPGNFNQAMMELGAIICTPSSPKCENCPVNVYCEGRKAKTVDSLPVKLKKVKVKTRYINYLVFRNRDNFALRERQAGDIWQGLYDFPSVECEIANAHDNVLSFLSGLELEIESINESHHLKHILTHQVIHATFWNVRLKKTSSKIEASFFSKNEIEQLPKPKLIVNYLQKIKYL